MLMLTVAVALKIAERITLVPEIVMHLYATNCLNWGKKTQSVPNHLGIHEGWTGVSWFYSWTSLGDASQTLPLILKMLLHQRILRIETVCKLSPFKTKTIFWSNLLITTQSRHTHHMWSKCRYLSRQGWWRRASL